MNARPSCLTAFSGQPGVFGIVLLFASLLPVQMLRAEPYPVDADKQAAPLADRVPANAVLYVGWHGADGLGPAYQGSRLKAVVDATDCNQLLGPFLPQLIDRIEKEDKDAANVIRTVLKIGKPMWRRPSAFFFSGIDWHGENDMPTPHLALICDAGADAEALEKELTQAVEEGLMQSPVPMLGEIKVMRMGEVVAIVAGYDKTMFPNAAKGDKADASLATDDAFKSALGRAGKEPVAVGYIDFDRVRDIVNTGVDRQGDADVKQHWPKVRDASGIEGLKQGIWACGFDGLDWVDRAFISAPAPRKGLLKLMDEKQISEDAVQLIPHTATLAGVACCDAGQCLDVLRSFVGDVDPDARQQFDGMLKQASDTSGINIEEGLLKSLGDEWVYYTDPRTGGRGVAGIVLVNHLKDPARVEESLSRLENVATAMLAEHMKDQPFKVSFYTARTGDLTIHYLGTPLVTPSWTIHDGNLYVALFPQVVVAATDHVAGKSKSILDNPDFAALRQRMGVEGPSSFQFMDLPRTAPDAYPQWLMVSRLSGFADLFGVQSPAMLAPPLSRLLPQLTAAGSASWVDNDGWHAKAISPFPGSNMLATDPFSGMMGMQPLALGAAAVQQRAVNVEPPKTEEVKPPPVIEQKTNPGPAPAPKPN